MTRDSAWTTRAKSNEIAASRDAGAPRHKLVTAGRDPASYHGFVNPPVYHASTVLYPSAEDFVAHRARYQYGRRGTPTTEALEQALQELEGPQCAGVSLLPSGLAAISAALLAVVPAGDHVLVTDSAYGPTRNFCENILNGSASRRPITIRSPARRSPTCCSRTRALVYLESPGSLSFEMQDIAAIAEAAHDKGALVLMDNTWATPLYFRPLDHGVDLVDPSRHQIYRRPFRRDARHGLRQCGDGRGAEKHRASHRPVRRARRRLSRIARLAHARVRLERHFEFGLAVGRWLEARPEVLRMLHPALPSHPGHAIWKRDFTGASGLFSMVLKPVPQKAYYAFLDTLELFGIGASWGGYESLAIPFDCAPFRTAKPWQPGGPTVRFHIGLEDVEDLSGRPRTRLCGARRRGAG